MLQISKEMEENQGNDDVDSLYMELVEIQKTIQEGELVLTDKMSSSEKFAEASGVILEDNPLQDDIDKANAEFESTTIHVIPSLVLSNILKIRLNDTGSFN